METQIQPLAGRVLIEHQATPSSVLETEDMIKVDGVSRGRILAVSDEAAAQGLAKDSLVVYETHAASGFKIEGQTVLSVEVGKVLSLLEP